MLIEATTPDIRFLDAFDLLGLSQWIAEATFPRSGNILDLILTNEDDRIRHVMVNPILQGVITAAYIADTSLTVTSSSRRKLHPITFYGIEGSMKQ